MEMFMNPSEWIILVIFCLVCLRVFKVKQADISYLSRDEALISQLDCCPLVGQRLDETGQGRVEDGSLLSGGHCLT